MVLLAGALLLCAVFAFGAGTLGWLGLAGACLVLVVALASFPVRGRGGQQRLLDLLVVATGGWTVVASRAFTAGNLHWLMFASAWAWLALGTLGIALAAADASRAIALLPDEDPGAAPAEHPPSRLRGRVVAAPGPRSRR